MKQRNIDEIIEKYKKKKMSFKERLIETFGVNSFKCTNYGSEIILWQVWYYKYVIIYDALNKSNYTMIVYDDIEKEDRNEYIIEQLELF